MSADLIAAKQSGRTIAIVGGGSIGIAFAIVFSRAGWPVKLFDPDASRRAAAPAEIMQRLIDLEAYGLLDETPGSIAARVAIESQLEQAVASAVLVQECAPEKVDLKKALFTELDAWAPPDALLASASSAIAASAFASELPGRARCLVTHPGNPPYLLPVIEIVPAPFTTSDAADRADALYLDAGLQPVRVAREVEGFIFNRLQGAMLREAYCLVRDGVASVDDIDRVVREGLGLRWSFMGPFETVDLNTRGGVESHAQKMGPAYERMGAERGQHDPWTADMVATVTAQRRALVPLEQWESRVAWRDRQLMLLAKSRKNRTD